MAKRKPKGDRQDIPEDLAARVLFDSDRTCCVCRTPGRRVQIHHIDEDPGNNVYENLAVICFDCHSQTHPTEAFARSLSAAQVRLYNASWRRLVRDRIDTPDEPHDLRTYREEVLLDLGLLPIHWVNALTIYTGGPQLKIIEPGRVDFWEPLIAKIDATIYPLDPEMWKRFKPLFTERTDEMLGRMKDLQLLHGDVIPLSLKTDLIRLTRSVILAQVMYVRLPLDIKLVIKSRQLAQALYNRTFTDMLKALQLFSEKVTAITTGSAS